MPQTLSQAMIDGTLGDMTQPPGEPLPWYLDMAESIPTISAVAATKTFRGSGTILRGGSGANIGGGSWVREGMRQANYARPRNWMQFGTQDYFHHQGPLTSVIQGPTRTGKPLRQTTYNPFYVSAGINAVGRGLGGQSEGRVAKRLANSELGKSMRRRGLVGEGRELVSKGFVSQVTASGRIGWMSNRQFGKSAGSTYNFLQGAGYTPEGAQSVLRGGKASTQAALLGSSSGTISGRLGGFAAQTLGPIDNAVYQGMSVSGQRGAAVAEKWATRIGARDATGRITARSAARATVGQVAQGATGMVGKKVAAGGALRGLGLIGGSLMTGPAAPAVAIAGAAWLVYDLAKLTTKGAGYAARIGVDAHKSFQGGLATGIMEQGFRDTEATMTSRARGVQAIQNSRLNARGVLGAEASAMHAHFG